MGDMSQGALDALTLVAALCALLFVASVLIGLVVAVVRVGVLGRVLVLPFKGAEPGQAQLTSLLIGTLLQMEEDWTGGARRIADLHEDFEKRTRARTGDDDGAPSASTPLTSGKQVDELLDGAATEGAPGVGLSPRSIGGESLEAILLLEESSLTGADLGSISIAGISFSPHAIFAVFERLPGLSARRVMSGAILNTGKNPIVTASYEERVFRGRHGRVRCTLQVPDDGWLTAIDQLAFELAKARIGMLRDRSAESARDKRRDPLRASGSRGADRTLVEAQSWAACRAFLAGYAAQIEHYLSGKGSDRERALEHYRDALEAQPGYTRAAYNRATLLYNRYLPPANKKAIDCFTAATAADDPRDRALALAGLAMAYAQAVNRFGEDGEKVVPKVIEASEAAMELAPGLEEARFARAWAYQLRCKWDEAIAAYDAIVQDVQNADATPPARRIASFCANNVGWILLTYFPDEAETLERAELYLWKAVLAYPNKIAYSNLARVAQRSGRYEEAFRLFGIALKLDGEYAAAWHERACLELEVAVAKRSQNEEAAARDLEEEAYRHQAHALELAGDTPYAKELTEKFDKKRAALASSPADSDGGRRRRPAAGRPRTPRTPATG